MLRALSARPGRDGASGGGKPRCHSEDAMDDFRETAIGLTLWYAVLSLLCGLLLIVLNDLDPHAACLAGADIALLFAIALIIKSRRLNEHSIVRGQFWRALPSNKRPHC